MTSKTISTYVAAGYTLAAKYSYLEILASGGVKFGVVANAYATIVNHAAINDGFSRSTAGVLLNAGGDFINGSTVYTNSIVEGQYGVKISGLGQVSNWGTIVGFVEAVVGSGTIANGAINDTTALIEGGIKLYGSANHLTNFGVIVAPSRPGAYLTGDVINGGNGDTTASIVGSGGLNVSGNVTNFGTIIGQSTYGVEDGGNINSVTNGSATDVKAMIVGYSNGVAIVGTSGPLTNFGAITATASKHGSSGVALGAYGQLKNGTVLDAGASISGYSGVSSSGSAFLANYGSIEGEAIYGEEAGVKLSGGGTVINGSSADRTARISGAGGVEMGGSATIFNFGTIFGAVGSGVVLAAGGAVTNGGGRDRSALIDGLNFGVYGFGGLVTVSNLGTISAQQEGVELKHGGAVTNGSMNNSAARIEGYNGLLLYASDYAAAVATNFGTIRGTGDFVGAGAYLNGGVNLTNGAAGHAGALIDGFNGVVAFPAYIPTTFGATVTNFGTITGEGGTALAFHANNEVLVVEAGCAFNGAVLGGGGTLDLASGAGTIGGLGNVNIVVSGSMASTAFTDFQFVTIAAPAQFALAGNGAVAAGQVLNIAGELSLGGTLTSSGTMTTGGTIDGAGVLAISGGATTFTSGSALTIASIAVSGASVVWIGANLFYAGQWAQTAGALNVGNGDTLTLSNASDLFSGSLPGSGTLALAGAGLTISAAGAALSGLGVLSLSGGAKVIGANGAATLTNVNDLISGGGALGGGQLTLVNQAGGTINANATAALSIDTGAAVVTNAGLLEATATGGLTIQSAVSNTGAIEALGGNVTVSGAVTGAGSVVINASTMAFGSTFSENVAFSGASGALVLAQAQTYSGSITGFSKTGGTTLDLLDIGFVSANEATYVGTKTGGILTVTDGNHTAKVNLKGNYLTSRFIAASDGHGGVIIHDPTVKATEMVVAVPVVTPCQLVAAMASFGATAAAATATAAPDAISAMSQLVSPRPGGG